MPHITIEQALVLAFEHCRGGRLQEAEKICRQILTHQPQQPDALNLLGLIAGKTGHINDAADLFGRAVAASPGNAEYHSNLSTALQDQGRVEEAISACRQALQLRPQYPEALCNLGNALRRVGRTEEAIASYQQALVLNPQFAGARMSLGNALLDQGQADYAIASYQQALALNPNYPEAHSNLGVALQNKRQLHEAIASYQRALSINPQYADAHNNLAGALRELGRFDEALQSYQRAISLNPHFAHAHVNRAQVLLLTGNFKEGWDEYEWRWKCGDFHSPRQRFNQPLYDKQELAGKTIVLHTEQGFGDAIQFARYVPLVARRGAKVVIHCQPALHRLFETLDGVASVHDRDTPLPPFDLHASFLSLPRVFETDLSSIPASIPYLKAGAAEVNGWRKILADRFANHSGALKVGLVWAGRPTHSEDLRRSLHLSALAPLFTVSNVVFVSLQKDAAASQIAAGGFDILDTSDRLKDFADTAALLESIDLLISVDTSVAHLAGALGRKAWTLIPPVPDWRWLQDRTDSPWYPTMRLWRQGMNEDWSPVIQSITLALAELAAGKFDQKGSA